MLQDSRHWVSGKISCQPRNRFSGPLAYALCSLRFAKGELSEAKPQPQDIELIDGKYSDATLRAPWAADKPFAAAPRSIGQGGVNDLNQFLVSTLNAILSVILNSGISSFGFIFAAAGR